MRNPNLGVTLRSNPKGLEKCRQVSQGHGLQVCKLWFGAYKICLFCKTPIRDPVPAPPNVPLLRAFTVSIRWYFECLQQVVSGAAGAATLGSKYPNTEYNPKIIMTIPSIKNPKYPTFATSDPWDKLFSTVLLFVHGTNSWNRCKEVHKGDQVTSSLRLS